MESISEAQIDGWLPQTQCTQCGYPRCLAYAKAILRGDADINQCPPGGEITINGIANLLNREAKPLNPEFGVHKPRQLAVILENECIGCTLCIQACPVDAIVGAGKLMHTVISNECTGCELCIPPCPMDCIDLTTNYLKDSKLTETGRWPEYPSEQVIRARRRTQNRIKRLRKIEALQKRRKSDHKIRSQSKDMKAEIAAAVARVRNKRPTPSPTSSKSS